VHDQARAWEVYERLAKNLEAEDRCYQIRWRAATKAGELLQKMEKAKAPAGPGRGHKTRSEVPTSFSDGPKTLAQLGLTKQQSSDWLLGKVAQ
jgi:hypothetical protein